MKRKVVALLWGIVSIGTFAQTSLTGVGDTLKMNLQDCVDYALKNNVNVKNATLDEEIAAAKVREVRSIGLPQINGSAGIQHYFELRNAYFPGGGPFAPPSDPTKPADVIVYPAIFQLPTNLDANITASQLLFNNSYFVGLQAAKTYKELSARSSQQTRIQTASNVKKAYYQNLVNTERIKLFDVNITRLDSTLKQMKALQRNGFAEQIDVDRIEVSLNNIMTEYEKTLSLVILSYLQLKFQMSMPLEQNLLLTDKIEQYTADTVLNKSDTYSVDNRPEYQLLKLSVKASKLDMKNNRGAALPSLALSGSFGAFSSTKNLNFFEGKRTEVFKSLTQAPEVRNVATYWSTYSFIQLGLNVPIFSGFERTSKIQQSKLNLQKSENNVKNFELAYDLQVQAAKANLQNSQRTIVMQKRNMKLAQNVSNISNKKYKAGTGSNLEVTDAEASLKEAQINYFNSLFDYLVFKTDYETAIGLDKY